LTYRYSLVADGVPRDCPTPFCGAEADTTVFQGDSPLGYTNGFGTVDPSKNIEIFMSGTAASAAQAAQGNQDAGISGFRKRIKHRRQLGGLLGGIFGGSNTGGDDTGGNDVAGTETAPGTVEEIVGQTAGDGRSSGLPTAGEDGTISLNLHQVNQDGGGPFQASVDPTSGGTDESAFQDAKVLDNVAGTSIGSLSLVTSTDFPVKVQIPQGTLCSGTVSGVKNVCILRMHNSAFAGPFGGSVAFTQSSASQKRAIEFQRLKRSRFARSF
jgi:hypothetical protein